MRRDTRKASEADADTARRAAVAGFVASLKYRLPSAGEGTALPDEVEATARQVACDADLPVRFTVAATKVGLQVHAVDSGWVAAIVELLSNEQVESVVLPVVDDGFLTRPRVAELATRLSAAGIVVHQATDDDTLFEADAAITGAVAAIAETGSLVCEAKHGVARSSSLVPPVHIAVVATSQLLADLCDYFGGLGELEELPANINLISGPSKTADIEGVLVMGVHGPGQVHVILVNEH